MLLNCSVRTTVCFGQNRAGLRPRRLPPPLDARCQLSRGRPTRYRPAADFPFDPDLRRHVSPIEWKNVILTTARSRSTPPSSRCATLIVYFCTNLVSTPPQPRFRGLLTLHSRYGRQGCSPTLQWTLSRGFDPPGYPTGPLVSYHVYRQLHGWGLPPLVICAVGAHLEILACMPGPLRRPMAYSLRELLEYRTCSTRQAPLLGRINSRDLNKRR